MDANFAAFVLGNSAYVDHEEFHPLPYAARDAAAVFDILTSTPTGLFDPALSRCNINLTKGEMLDELTAFFKPLTKQHTVLLYFCCHGRTLGQKHLALIMSNTLKDSIAGTGFDVSSVISFLAERNITRYVIILDCCRAGRAMTSPGIRWRGMSNDEVDVDAMSGLGKWVVTSCQDYQNAHELEELEHGLFSHYFLEGIKTGAAARRADEYIDVPSICVYATKNIKSRHKALVQEPGYSGEDLKGHPVFIARNPIFEPRFDASLFLANAVARTLSLNDLSSEAQLDLMRAEKLREFMETLPPRSDFLKWDQVVSQMGNALGFGHQEIDQLSLEYLRRLSFDLGSSTLHISLVSPAGYAIFASTSSRRVAYSFPETGSLFGSYFNEAISGSAADEFEAVTLGAVQDYVRQKILALGSDLDQVPQLSCFKNMADYQLTKGRVSDLPRKRVALLVGTDHYLDPNLPSLSAVEMQLKEAAKILESKGGFEVTLLLGRELTRTSLLDAINVAVQGPGPAVDFLFYFQGHGGFDRADSRYRLVLTDSDPSDPRTLIDFSTINLALKRGRQASLIVVVDASFAGAAVDALLGPSELLMM